jgi:hypothetical protein
MSTPSTEWSEEAFEDEPPASSRSEQRTHELLQALRFCGSTLLRGLTSASRRCESAPLRHLFDALTLEHAVRHTTLIDHLDETEFAPSPRALATLGWLAARGCLPEGDDAIVRRCRELAHDLLVRCEELLQGAPTSGWATLLRGYAESTRALRDRLAAQEQGH